MIAWWWALLALIVGWVVSQRVTAFAITRQLKDPASPGFRMMDKESDKLLNVSAEQYAKVAEAHDGKTGCPLKCGREIAAILRKGHPG